MFFRVGVAFFFSFFLKKLTHFVTLSQEEAVRRGVYSPQELYTFPATRVGESSTLKVNIRNNSSDMHEVRREFLMRISCLSAAEIWMQNVNVHRDVQSM